MCMQGYATTSKKTSIPDIEHIRILIPQEEATESVVIFNSDSNQSPSEEIVQVTSAETSHETGDAQESAETSVPFNSPELSPLGSEDAFQSKTDQDLSQPSTSRPSDMLAEEPQASSQDSIQKEGVGTSIDSSENHSLLSSRTAGEQATETLESQRKESHPAPKAVDGANCFVFPAGMPRSQQESSNLFSIEESTCSNAPAASIRIREQSLSVRNDVPGSILGFQLIEGEVCVLLKFSWCQSPNAIYFRTREMSEMMHALNTKMREHYKDSKPVASLLNFEIGCMCAVFCEENWQRAQIIDIDESSTFEVNLLDRGLQRTVDASNIRRIEPEFEKYPKLILGVSLYGVYPVSGNWDQKVNHL